MSLRNSIFIIFLCLFLCGCTVEEKLVNTNYSVIGTEESIGLYRDLKSDTSRKIAVLDVAPSNYSKDKVENIYDYGYPLSDEMSHSDFITALISEYIPENIGIDIYCPGIDEINIDSLKEALVDITTKDYLVVNMSFVFPHRDTEITNLLKNINKKNTFLVSSAGNHSLPYSEFPGNLSSVLSIGGIDDSGQLWEHSNFKDIDFVMPVNFRSSNLDVKVEQGTSISAAYMTVYLTQLLTINSKLANEKKEIVLKEIINESTNNSINELIGNGQPKLKEDFK